MVTRPTHTLTRSGAGSLRVSGL